MSRREKTKHVKSYSTRSYLVGTLLIVTIFVTFLGTYFAVLDSHRAARDAGNEAKFEATLASGAVSDAIGQSLATLSTQIADPTTITLVRQLIANPVTCKATTSSGGFGAFPDGETYFFDLSGRVLCASVRDAKPGSSFSKVPWFRTLSSKTELSPVFVDPVNGKLSIATVGFLEQNGRRFAGFASTLIFDSLSSSLTKQYGGRFKTAFNLVEPTTAQDLSGPPGAIWRVSHSSPLKPIGSITRAGVDGVHRIYSAVAVPGTKWILVASVHESLALAGARASEHHQIWVALIALVILFIFGLAINRNIVGPIRRLRTAVEQAGRDVVPAALTLEGPSEVAELVQEFNGMIVSRAESEQRLTHQALHDHLTELPNRALIVDRISKALERAQRTNTSVAVLFVDLDRFRIVNDGLGHTGGDRVLREIARRIEGVLRPGDSVGRLNADEFVILCEELSSTVQATLLAIEIGVAIAEPIVVGERDVSVTASIGIAIARAGDTAADLLRNADVAMMKAKKGGRARQEFFDESLNIGAQTRLQMESDLRQALDRREFLLYYQPVVDVGQGMIGAEALIRWQHPTNGLQLPLSFIPIAEETGLIVPIGIFVLEEACKQAAEWHVTGRPMRVSVNLSARQLVDEGLPAEVQRILTETGLPPSRLCLEITESTLMDEAIQPVVLQRLKQIGVILSIDDFGTGYSSLAYIQRFPVDELKIDRSFVRALTAYDSSEALVEAIIRMARALGIDVVVEGVEELRQLETLQILGAVRMQGYYFSRPAPASELEGFAARLAATAWGVSSA